VTRRGGTTWADLASSWRRSLGIQLLAVLFLVSCTLSVVASIYDYRVEEASAREWLLGLGRMVARQAAVACADGVASTDTALDGYVDDLVETESHVAFAEVRRTEGNKVLACNPRTRDTQYPPDSILQIEEPIRVERDGEQIGTFVLGLSLQPMQAKLREKSTRMLIRGSLGFLLVAALFWVALRALVMRPLHRLDEAALRLGRGELDQPLEELGSSELGRLSRTMDEMRRNLLSSHRSLAAQNQQLVELSRLKSQFLANMSHEMRTPLTSILGGVELLVEIAGNDVERRETAASVQRNGEQLLDLVDRLLDLAKLETGNLLVEARTCRPEAVVREAIARSAGLAASKGLELRADLAGIAARTATTDPARLRQLVTTVVGNAVKFTDRGSVEVRASLLPSATGHLLQVEVTDTGIGIPAEFLPRMFESFSQADGSLTRRHGGSGLGLAIARRVAQQLGGDVVITSEVGRGTRVVITIAVTGVAEAAVVAPVPAPSVKTAPVPAAAALRGRVLVVDDAPDNQRLLKAILTKAGVTVDLAANGREAVEAVQKTVGGAAFDLVLMDLQMPELDGVSAIRQLREQGFALPIVALTAHALAEDRERCLAAGATGYETKPIARQKLLDVVSRHLRPSTV